jgi:multidrug efflux system outer membrane protein
MRNKTIITAAVALFMTGCTMIPAYERPVSPVAAEFSPKYYQSGVVDNETKQYSEVSWQEFFLAPELKVLIERALENNRDLRVAALNTEAAQAAYRIRRADFLPSVNANGQWTRQGVPENISATGQRYTASNFSVGLGVAAYEFDLFGRVRSLSEKALESYFATEEARNATQITLISEIAGAYLAYLGDTEMLMLAEETLKNRQKSYDLVKRSFDMGNVSRLDLEQSATLVESAKAAVAQYNRLRSQDLNALALLVGGEVDPTSLSMRLPEEITAIREIPAGLSSETLLNRPDIRMAEHNMKAANADIGAARAAFFPSITLTANAGLASSSLDTLFKSGSGLAWTFMPQINIPIFHAGRNKATLEVAKVNQKIAAAEYEKAIQTAFREVSDQLASRATYLEQLEAQEALVAAAARVFDLANDRYKFGVSRYTEVLDAHRTLFEAEQGLVSLKRQYLSNLVTLYKVLGGGQI